MSGLEALAETWRREIPITGAMAIQPVSFEGHCLRVEASLEANRNLHGTAFAGSLYALSALAGWGLVHLELEQLGLTGTIVLASGEIDYRRPVKETLIAEAASTSTQVTEISELLREQGRARWPLEARINAAGQEAVFFQGVYAIKLRA